MTDQKIDIANLNPTDGIQASWLKLIHRTEVTAENRRVFFYVGSDERFVIEMVICYHDLNNKHDLMNIWKSLGYIDKAYDTHINITTYYCDVNGNWWGYYNPTYTPDHKIDFNKVLPYSPENAAMLIAEAIRMEEMDITHDWRLKFVQRRRIGNGIMGT